MNTVHLMGNIGAEPVVSQFQSGKRVARFSVALNSYSKDPSKKLPPTWIDCEMWDAAVDRLLKCKEKAALKGRKIQVSGSLAMNEYKKDLGGQSVTQRKLYVKVLSFELIGGLQPSEQYEQAPAEVMAVAEKPAKQAAQA